MWKNCKKDSEIQFGLSERQFCKISILSLYSRLDSEKMVCISTLKNKAIDTVPHKRHEYWKMREDWKVVC